VNYPFNRVFVSVRLAPFPVGRIVQDYTRKTVQLLVVDCRKRSLSRHFGFPISKEKPPTVCGHVMTGIVGDGEESEGFWSFDSLLLELIIFGL